MSEALPPPTAECRRLVQCVGPAAALALIEARGGTRLFVPKKRSAQISEVIGMDAARILSEAFGGNYLKVPVARTWRVLIYKARGLSYAEMARKVGCGEDTIWRILSHHDLTAKQYDLFPA